MKSDSRNHAGMVLIVDDAPDNLAVLHDVLDQQGFLVRVATSGAAALESAQRMAPDLILLDALMPGLDGFETCRRLKASLQTRHIPVVFMTGLTDTDHVLRGFRAGGIDYVSKPIRPLEVVARIESHLRNSRLVADTLRAADAAGDAIVAIDAGQRLQWATPLAQSWLQPVLDAGGDLPEPLRRWLITGGGADERTYTLLAEGQRLVFSRLPAAVGESGIRLLVQRHAPIPEPAVLARALSLTAREAEVLYWVSLGKTNPDIAVILDMSPRTVNKHLEHIFTKLNVETRTAAAAVALNKGRIGAAAAPARGDRTTMTQG